MATLRVHPEAQAKVSVVGSSGEVKCQRGVAPSGPELWASVPSPAPESWGVLLPRVLPEATDPLGVSEAAVVQRSEMKPKASVKSAGLGPARATHRPGEGLARVTSGSFTQKGHTPALCLCPLAEDFVLFETESPYYVALAVLELTM